jgi:hypothetical protein
MLSCRRSVGSGAAGDIADICIAGGFGVTTGRAFAFTSAKGAGIITTAAIATTAIIVTS